MSEMMQLCAHRQNPKACLQCFSAPKAKAPVDKQGIVPLNGIPLARLPGQAGAAPIGDRSTAGIGQRISGVAPVTPEERARHRGEHGRAPVSHNAAPAPALPGGYSSEAADSGTYDQEGLWSPPARPRIMDRLPQHPEAGKMR